MNRRNKNQSNRASETCGTSPKAIEAVFALESSEAQEVNLCGDFNGWTARSLPMIRRDGRRWEKRLALPPGRYEYKLLVDGEWMPDPCGPQEVVNAFGSINSVADVQ
jgi:1,4-alpha-glucan branching enzyme